MSEKKLPAIAGALSEEYTELALMNFTMEFYNVYEQFYDCELGFIENGRTILDAVVSMAKNIYTGESDDREAVTLLEKTRKEIMDRMEVLTAYTDWFQIHEYLLNRAELKFSEKLPEVDNDEEARKILQFIFEPEDNMEVNLRIKEMVSQMPVRMTGVRFFDLLKDSITVYKGAERESLNGFIYMVLSAAGMYKPDVPEYFTDLEAYKNVFAQVHYKELDKQTFDMLEEKMAEVSGALTERTEFCIAVQKLVNNLYTYYLVKPYTSGEPALKEQLKEVILTVCGHFIHESENNGDFIATDIEKANAVFTMLEGRPEKLVTKISVSEGRLESVREELGGIDPEIYTDFEKASKLMSSSDFAKTEDGCDTTECSQEIIEAACGELLEYLRAELAGKDKQVRRAIMASVLKELPVFFVSRTEVMNYLRFTLEHCKDNAEKTASLRMFWRVYE